MDLRRTLNGTWLKSPAEDSEIDYRRVCDDSRQIASGDLFVAIHGELSDGHKYVAQAGKSGASVIIVQDAPTAEVLSELGCPCLQVADSLIAFQQLAALHRQAMTGVTVLGITGSCGKTSSKEMCAAVLETLHPGQVIKTEGNTNNHFGVPRNLFRIGADTKIAVIEMGSNHPGEIANLVSLSKPDVSLICNIGHAHLEFFKDLRGVATEKGDILAGTKADGTVVIPGEAVGIDILRAKAGQRKIVTFGAGAENDVQGEYLGYQPEYNQFAVRITWHKLKEVREFRWNIGGAHQAINAAGAAAVGMVFGVAPDMIVAGLKQCVLPGDRLSITQKDGVYWANDAYNANPDSTMAALNWFAEVSASAVGKRILVLGEMRELGPEVAPVEHERMLMAAKEKFADARIIAVGKSYEPAAKQLQLEYFPDMEGVLALKDELAVAGNWILLKGSNGVGVYRLAR